MSGKNLYMQCAKNSKSISLNSEINKDLFLLVIKIKI